MNVIHTEKSQYRDIVIFEDDEQRCMSFNRHNQSARQSSQSLDDPNQFVFSYTKLMMGALYLNPAPRRILIVGLGGGMLPTALAQILPDAELKVYKGGSHGICTTHKHQINDDLLAFIQK